MRVIEGISKTEIGNRITYLRERRGLTQTQLTLRAGMANSSLSHIESGIQYPSLSNLVRLCRALSVSADHVLGLD